MTALLLHAKVPDKPRVGAVAAHDGLLLKGRSEPIAGHEANLLAIAREF